MELSDLIGYIVRGGFLVFTEPVLLLKPCSKKGNMILNSSKIFKGSIVNPNPNSSKTYFSGQYGSGSVVLVEKSNQKKVIEELRLRSHFRHPNIVFIVGICILDTLCLVLPGEAQNSLHQYIQKLNSSNTKRMTKACHDICNGMSYLHSINCLHRALQSRACIVDKEGIVKISDFDKSVYLQSDSSDPLPGRKSVLVPTRWAAPEVITIFNFFLSTSIFFDVLL